MPTKNIFIFLFFTFQFLSCEKEQIDNSDKNFPVILLANHVDRSVILQWNKINISDFEHYAIVRSEEPILDGLQPTVVLATRGDVDSIFFVDNSYPFAEKLYYKIYAKTEDRYLRSESVEVHLNINLIDLVTERAVHSTSSHCLFLFDKIKNTLFRYDYEQDSITHQYGGISSDNIVLSIAKTVDGEEEILLGKSTNTHIIKILDAKNLQQKGDLFADSFVNDVEAKDGLMFVATGFFVQPLSIYDQASLNFLQGYNIGSTSNRILKVLPGNDIRLLECAQTYFHISDFNQYGDLLDYNTSTGIFDLLKEVVVSNDGQYFIATKEGEIFDHSLNFIAKINDADFIDIKDFVFSNNGEKLGVLDLNVLTVLHFPSLEFIKEIHFNYNTVKAFATSDNHVMVIGTVNSSGKIMTVVEKIRI